MGEVRAQSRYTTDRKRPSQLDRAQRINLMQSRTCMNQIEILENNIRKKLKVIENEKYEVARYLRFLKTSSGVSSFSEQCPRSRDIRIRPATACAPVMKFGRSGNANHSYMVSDPAFGWSDSKSDEDSSPIRVRSACMSRSRMTAFHRTMTRIRKIEQPLRKRVSWVDGGQGGDDGIMPYSPRGQAYRSLSNPNNDDSEGTKKSFGTQCESPLPKTEQNDRYQEEIEMSPKGKKNSNLSAATSRRSSASSSAGLRNRPNRERKTLKPINVTFPFAITPDGQQTEDDSGNVHIIRPSSTQDRAQHANSFHTRPLRPKR
ncbi:uncharacterized protein LOC104266261 [Ciona intestinalis]